mmetsp:Transcript_47899/g.111912  ORF Transcript_47899/g.111912 Transcript_47899/m.111912 type:complete len:88 (+) Transcript_47899:1286-1549(+)
MPPALVWGEVMHQSMAASLLSDGTYAYDVRISHYFVTLAQERPLRACGSCPVGGCVEFILSTKVKDPSLRLPSNSEGGTRALRLAFC